MSYRRIISTRATLLARRRFRSSFSYIHHDNDECREHSIGEDKKINNFFQRRFFGNSGINTSAGFGTLFQDQRCSQFFVPPMTGAIFSRNMSTTIGEGADKIGYMTDVAEVLTDKTVEVVASQAPAVSEVAIAAADSFFPVAALQYVIDGVHSFTGLNWWASIVITTLLIRGLTIPVLINQLKATSKLTIMRPHLDEIKDEMENRGMSPSSVAEGQKQMKELFKEHGVTPWTPLKGLFIQGPVFVSFFLAISNMVEKVPSFKTGGAFWFTDLTTPDTLCIFPVLAALTFWITVECNAQEGLEGNPVAGTMKKVSRVFAALTVPITMTFPKALFCYWVTSNLFSLMYGLVIKRPAVKNFLGVPIIPIQPAGTATKPSLSFVESIKQYAAAMQKANQSGSAPAGLPKLPDHRISSSAVTSQRLRRLEKEVKGRKKNKKR
ncbi:mitochondrial inner membrane protein OXA1 [Cornus florida]|uniref:mitochondrial inner membrane protein OXA1 n=1 Tax=Cornus florida TaxID=4283 RepID=UPI0028A2B33C|nr:mitochondrial inner membrane protein OXA1 [Cornus florida]